jgi:hypothetical protein
VQARLARLEEGLSALTLYATDGQPSRLGRSVGAAGGGGRLAEIFDELEAERDLREAGAE